MSRRAGAAALLVAAGLLAGCTGVPTNSLPQTIESVGVGKPSDTAGGPKPNDPARKIVLGFLSASTSDPVKHSIARKYLTPAARNRWSDTAATIVANINVGTPSADGTVVVTGSKVGSLDEDGVYTPTPDGIGHGGAVVPFIFNTESVKGQNRISALPRGLLLTEQQFRTYYRQRTVYFFDNDERYLVPDPRYSALRDRVQLADWLLDRLQQSRPSLSGVVNTDPLAAQPQRISARTNGTSVTVQVPGARQLGSDVLNRLAAQISSTLDPALDIGDFSIVDGGRKVLIPRVNKTVFTAADFASVLGPPRPADDVYYLRSGRIRTQAGKALTGPLGNGTVFLDSVAVAQRPTIRSLAVAGVQRSEAGVERLVFGTQTSGVRPVALPAGRLTRPAWFPDRNEVWIGDNAKLYRLTTTDGRTGKVSQVPIPSLNGGGRLTAVRPSPDGSQVALVVEGANDQPQLYVASVVRTGSTVQVEGATLISPSGVVVTDAAWIDPIRLYAIGYLAQSKESEVYRTNVDGASWVNDGIGALPNPPDSITMANDASPWVSAAGYVWAYRDSPEQRGDLNGGQTWVSPVVKDGQTPGDNPVYLG